MRNATTPPTRPSSPGAGTHESWSSTLVFLLASVGAAVGLGNLWLFPYLTGTGGGGAFVLVYVIAVGVIVAPLVMAEIVIGRHGRMSPPNTLRSLAESIGASPRWAWLGWLGMLTLFLAFSFYSVVAGWTLAYAWKSAAGVYSGFDAEQVAALFQAFQADPLEMTAWHAVVMILTIWIVSRGLRAGIERAVKSLMPALFALLLLLVGYAAIAGDFKAAAEFLFRPDFSKLTPGIMMAAIGMAFASVSVGFGVLLTMAAYLPTHVPVPRLAAVIAGADTLVAILAGLAIFPIVFGYGLDAAGGPGLVFLTLSTGFAQMPLGRWVGSAFFLLMALAALTSTISMVEVLMSRLIETRRLTRPRGALLVGSSAFVLGLATVFSFNLWADVRPIAEMTVFDLIRYLCISVLAPLGGLLYALFAGWWLPEALLLEELGLSRGSLYRTLRFLMRYVTPLAIGAVLIAGIARPG